MCYALDSDSNEYCILQFFIVIVFLTLVCYAANKLITEYASAIRYRYYGKKAGPLEWSRLYPDAQGKRQSPINVLTDEVCCMHYHKETNSCPLTFQGYDTLPIQYTLSNDGVKAVFTGKWRDGEAPFLTGGPLGRARYFFWSLNFRWGPSDEWGSEHMLNYRRYPLELQLVHKSTSQPAAQEDKCSSASGDSICVVSYFYDIVDQENVYLNPIVHEFGRIKNVGSKVSIQPFPLRWLAPPFTHEYFTYPGSLTEPPCSEIAIWLLKFCPTLCVSREQLGQFRKLRSREGPIMINSRPVQNLNGRAVCYYAHN